MFGISWSEFLIIIVLALILLGPEMIPKVFTTMGKLLRELRATSAELQEELRRALPNSEEMDVSLRPPWNNLLSSMEEETPPTSYSEKPYPPSSSSSPDKHPDFGTPVRVKRPS